MAMIAILHPLLSLILAAAAAPGRAASLVALRARGSASSSSSLSSDAPAPAAYKVWGSDQSNSVPGQSAGSRGSYLWTRDSQSIEAQIAGVPDAVPLGCVPGAASTGPCDLLDVFPPPAETGRRERQRDALELGDLPKFGRLHGMIKDLSNQYVTANIFTPEGGVSS